MRHVGEIGAAVALSVALTGCTNSPTQEQGPTTISASPEATPIPGPGGLVGDLACSNATSKEALTFPERETLEFFKEYYKGASPEELNSTAIQGVADLNTVTAVAEDATVPDYITAPNPNHPEFSFYYSRDRTTGSIIINESTQDRTGDCLITSIVRSPSDTTGSTVPITETMKITLGQHNYDLRVDSVKRTVALANGDNITPNAVATLSILASRYNRILELLQIEGPPSFPRRDSYYNEPNIIYPSVI